MAGNSGPVVLINLFEVPAQEGHRSTALHRSLRPDAEFRFVNVGGHESAQAFQAAIGQPAFREAAAAIRHRAHPGLYEIIRR